MSEDGQRPSGQRRTGPNPGPHPWPGPGPGSDVLEDANSFRRPHLRIDHHKRANTNPDHRHSLLERSNQSHDLDRRAPSSKIHQTRVQDPGNHYHHCNLYEYKTSTVSTTPEAFHNKLLTFSDNRTKRNKDQGIGHSSLSSAVPREKLRGSPGTGGYHGQKSNFKYHFKKHSVKLRDPLAYPVSVHPVQPSNLRTKIAVNKESVASYRQILSSEAVAPAMETCSQFSGPTKRLDASLRLVCAHTSNPDIKVPNVDHACSTTSYIEPTPTDNKIAEQDGSGLVLTREKSSFSLPQIDGIPAQTSTTDEVTADYPLIRRHDTQIQRVEYSLCPQVHRTASDGGELKMEKYIPPEDDSMKCSIHTCAMSSSFVSVVSLEHDRTPSEKLARDLQRIDTPQMLSGVNTISTLTGKEIVMAHDIVTDQLEGLRERVRGMQSVSYTSVSPELNSDEYNSDDENRYLKDSCNDTDIDHNLRNEKIRFTDRKNDEITSGINKRTSGEKTPELNDQIRNMDDSTDKSAPRSPKLEQLALHPIENDSSFARTIDNTTTVGINQNANINMAVLVATPLDSDRPDERLFMIESKELMIDILEEQKPECVSKERGMESASESNPLITVDSFNDKESIAVSLNSKLIVTATDGSCQIAFPQDVENTAVFPSHQQNSLSAKNSHTRIIKRRNTVPQIGRDLNTSVYLHNEKEKPATKDSIVDLQNVFSAETEEKAEIIQDKFSAETVPQSRRIGFFQDSDLLFFKDKDFVAENPENTQKTGEVECQVSFTSTDEIETESGESITARDEYVTNRLNLVSTHGMRLYSQDTPQSKALQDGISQASVLTLDDVKTNRDECEPQLSNVSPEKRTEVSEDLCDLKPALHDSTTNNTANHIESHFNQNTKSVDVLQATVKDFFSHSSESIRRNYEDVSRENEVCFTEPSAEAPNYQVGVLIPTQEDNSSDHKTMRNKTTEDGRFSTSDFCHNIDDGHSPENLDSSVENEIRPAKSSSDYNVSCRASCTGGYEKSESVLRNQISQNDCSTPAQKVECTTYYSFHENARSKDKLAQDKNICDLNSSGTICKEIHKLSPAETRIKNSSPEGRGCQVCGKYIDQNNVDIELASYQSENRNGFSDLSEVCGDEKSAYVLSGRSEKSYSDTEKTSLRKDSEEVCGVGVVEERSRIKTNNSQQTTVQKGSSNSEIAVASRGHKIRTDSWTKIEQQSESHIAGYKHPSNFREGTQATSVEKTDSSKETRDSSIFAESESDSEEPKCMAEQLSQGKADMGESEENMTAKSVAELTDEDIMSQSEERNIDMTDINEGKSLDNTERSVRRDMSVELTERMNVPNDGAPLSLDASPEVKTVVWRYCVRRSFSGVRIITLDDGLKVSAFIKISDKIPGVGNQMCMLKNQVVMSLAPKSHSQLILKENQFPHESDVVSNHSSLSWDIRNGDKCILKSGGPSRESPRVETISVKNENEAATQRSVEIITINDPTEFEKHSNDDCVIIESPSGTRVSTSSCCTRVLLDPHSCHSIETNKDLSEIIEGGFYKMQICQNVDDETRTKLKKHADRKLEARNRVHLVGTGNGQNEDEMNYCRKKSSVRNTKSISDDYSIRWRPESQRQDEDLKLIGKRLCNLETVIRKDILTRDKGVPSYSERYEFEQYRSTSDLCMSQFNRVASAFEDSDYSPEQSVSPSLLNLGRFTPPNLSSWSTVRRRQALGLSSNVLAVPSKYSARVVHSDEDINLTRRRKPSSRESKRSSRRSDDFPSSEDVRFRRTGRNMYTEDPDAVRDESGAACLNYLPDNHGTRVVTFENIPSPRSTLRRSTPTPRGESAQTFDYVSESFEDTRQARSPIHRYSDEYPRISRVSSDASGSANDLSSAAQMSRQGRLVTSVARNRYYEEVPYFQETAQKDRGCVEKQSAERLLTIWPRSPQHLTTRTSSAVQTKPVTPRSHPDLRMPTSSKTTLLSLAEAGMHSSSRLSSPTPSDIPSPPPNPSPNSLTIFPRQTKVDVAVGIGTFDYDPFLVEPVLSASCNIDDSPTTIEIPISPTRNQHSSLGSATASGVVAVPCLRENVSNSAQSDRTHKSGGMTPIFVPSNIYSRRVSVNRGVGVTTTPTDKCTSSSTDRTPMGSSQERINFQKVQQHSRGTSCSTNRFRSQAICFKDTAFSSNTLPKGKAEEKKKDKPKRNSGSRSYDSIASTDSSANGTTADVIRNRKCQRSAVLSGHYRFGSANFHCRQYSDLMGDIGDVSSAVPNRMTPSHSSVSPNRLSPKIGGTHSRFIGTRLSVHSTSRNDIPDVEFRGRHRERPSYAQKPSPTPIKRPADASCTSCTHTETSGANAQAPADVNQQSSVYTNQRTYNVEQSTVGGDERYCKDLIKEPLPPAALDESEEGWDSKRETSSFSDADMHLDGAPLAASTPIPEPAVRFSGSRSKRRVSSDVADPRGQSLSTPETGSMSYPGAPSFSIPSTGKSIPDSVRESTCEDVPSLSRQEGSIPSAQPPLDQLPVDQQPIRRQSLCCAVANSGVICPEINISSQPKHKICISIKSSNSGPFCRTIVSPAAPELHVTRIIDPLLQEETTQSEIYDPDDESVTNGADTALNSEPCRSQGTLTDRIRESIVRAHGHKKSRSSPHSGVEKKSSQTHKCTHKTGNKKKGSVPNHVIRTTPTSSKTSQSKATKSIVVTVSSSAVEITSHPPLVEVEGEFRSQDRDGDGGDVDEENCEEASYIEESYIEEESENTENPSTGRLPCVSGSHAVNNITIVESDATGTRGFPSGAVPNSAAELFTRPDVALGAYKGQSYFTETSGMAGPYNMSEPRELTGPSRPWLSGTKQDVASMAMTQDQPGTAEAERGRMRQLQATTCVADALCKNVKRSSLGKRNGLYTTRVGYIGPLRPLHPMAATRCRLGEFDCLNCFL